MLRSSLLWYVLPLPVVSHRSPRGVYINLTSFALAQPKICSRSDRIAVRILSATLKPNRLVVSQTQEYTFRYFGSKKVRSMLPFLH